jgi:hypothetical protein
MRWITINQWPKVPMEEYPPEYGRLLSVLQESLGALEPFEIMAEPLSRDEFEQLSKSLCYHGRKRPRVTPATELSENGFIYATGVSWIDAATVGLLHGMTLPTEAQWECLLFHKLSGLVNATRVNISDQFDEWCLDYYSEDRLQRYLQGEYPLLEPGGAIGCPVGRRVIRGHSPLSPIRSPLVRGHGLDGNRPFWSTTFRYVRKHS